MASYSTKIIKSNPDKIKEVILSNFDGLVEPKEHALWQIRHKNFCAIFYKTSKFLIQGKDIDGLLKVLGENFEEIVSETKVKEIAETPVVAYSTYIGTDESGKGDFFGPLVVSAVLIEEKNRQMFIDLGIKDSKTLTDTKIAELALKIQKHAKFSTVAMSNEKYNELYANFKNLNKLLAWGHARVIENILEKAPCEYALSDKFGDESLIKNALLKNGRAIKLDQRVRAESDIAVACASVVARATFVQKMKSMEKFYGCNFPKGASAQVKACAKVFVQKYGKDRLKEVCKVHFKTFNEI